MKKFTVLMLAALLVVAFTVPASAALENTFGGYWRTRMFTQKDFDGDGNGSKDKTMVDTRTRLYYTAKLNDNLKFVNKFEFDSGWGTAASYGRVGTDATVIEVKNTYVDANIGPVNLIVGAQPFTLARGFIGDEDGIGMKLIYKVNDGLYLPFVWQKAYDGNDTNMFGAANADDYDIDMYIFTPIIMLSKDIKINPYYVYLASDNGAVFSTAVPVWAAGSFEELAVHIFGLDFDAKFGAASLWFTGIMQTGSVTLASTKTDIDVAGYLLAAGGKFDLGKADVHGQIFYATGEEDGLADGEANAFIGTGSQYYYWAEILGAGIFDQQFPNATPGYRTSNILVANIGAGFKPMDKLKVTADLWWAKLAEDNAFGEDKLGIEADVVLTYQLVEGLSLDIVGAYLFAGDALSADGKNDNNPYELGTRLSLSF